MQVFKKRWKKGRLNEEEDELDALQGKTCHHPSPWYHHVVLLRVPPYAP